MIVKREESIWGFDFWCGADENRDKLTSKQCEQIEEVISCEYPDGIDETELNDLFRFDFDWVCSLAGIEIDEEDEDD